MLKKYGRCNTCGVPESKWRNGRCWECGRNHCEMTPDVTLEQRVYDWLQKQRVSGPNVYPRDVVINIRIRLGAGKPVPRMVKTYVDAFHKAIAAHRGRDIPYYIIFDGRFLKLAFATDRFLYYDDDLEMPVMFRTEDGTLVSNNEFAKIGYHDSLDAIELGEESVLTLEAQPEWSLQEFVADCFPNGKQDAAPQPPVSYRKQNDADDIPL